MAEKARTPMSGAEREAKYAAKMKEKDYEEMHRKHERAKTERDEEKRRGEEKRKKSC